MEHEEVEQGCGARGAVGPGSLAPPAPQPPSPPRWPYPAPASWPPRPAPAAPGSALRSTAAWGEQGWGGEHCTCLWPWPTLPHGQLGTVHAPTSAPQPQRAAPGHGGGPGAVGLPRAGTHSSAGDSGLSGSGYGSTTVATGGSGLANRQGGLPVPRGAAHSGLTPPPTALQTHECRPSLSARSPALAPPMATWYLTRTCAPVAMQTPALCLPSPVPPYLLVPALGAAQAAGPSSSSSSTGAFLIPRPRAAAHENTGIGADPGGRREGPWEPGAGRGAGAPGAVPVPARRGRCAGHAERVGPAGAAHAMQPPVPTHPAHAQPGTAGAPRYPLTQPRPRVGAARPAPGPRRRHGPALPPRPGAAPPGPARPYPARGVQGFSRTEGVPGQRRD